MKTERPSPRVFGWIGIAAACLALLQPSSSSALQMSHKTEALSRMLGSQHGYGNEFAPEVFAPYSRILVLADAPETPETDDELSLGARIAQAYPDKAVFSGDIRFEKRKDNGNHTELRVDNNGRFPFADNEFDLVVMRKGLCVCDGAKCCAGFAPEMARPFFAEVVRVMDKSNPDSRAVLHGCFGVTPDIRHAWSETLSELESTTGVQATIYLLKPAIFLMIGIQP